MANQSNINNNNSKKFWIDFTQEEKDAYQKYLLARVEKLLQKEELK